MALFINLTVCLGEWRLQQTMVERSKEESQMYDVSLQQSTWLQQRMCAHHDHITSIQVDRFGKFPDTALTPLCVEAHRFPEMFRSSFIQIDISPDGEPCFMTEIDNFCVCIVGDKMYKLAPVLPESGDTHFKIQLLGFINHEPVCLVVGECGFEDNLTPWDKFVTRKNRLCQGEHVLREMQGLINALILTDEAFLLFTLDNEPQLSIDLSLMIHGGVKCSEQLTPITTRQYRELKEAGFTTDGIYLRSATRTADRQSQVLETKQVLHSNCFPPALRQLLEESGDNIRQSEQFRLGSIIIHEHNEYLRWAQNVHWNYTYVARSARDNLECWMIHPKAQPAFPCVSRLFERDGKFFYYAVGGDHWFLMELPLTK